MILNRRIRSVYQKELMDILRDRRTLIAMIVVPIALYPILMMFFANAAGDQTSQILEESMVIGVKSQQSQDFFIDLIKRDVLALRDEQGLPPFDPRLPVQDQPVKPVGGLEEDAIFEMVQDTTLERAIRDGRIHVGIEFPKGFAPPRPGSPVVIKMYVLDELIRSRVAGIRISDFVERINNRLSPDPIEINEVSLTTPSSILSVILPLILVLMTITGAIYPAIDLTAGERERGTLESLMVCPVPVSDLITGKFLVVTTVAIAGAALNLASVSATVYLGGFSDLVQAPTTYVPPDEAEAVAQGAEAPPSDASEDEEGFPLSTLPIILACLIPFAVLMSAIMIAVSACARTFKEAQNYVTPVILAVLLPGGVAALPGTELTGGMLVMPVANMVLLTRDLLRGASVVPLSSIATVLISTSIYAAGAVALATRVFGIESVVFSDSGSIRTTLMRKFFRPVYRPPVTMVALIVALLLPVWFYIQTALTPMDMSHVADLIWGTAKLMPLCFVLIPALIMIYWKVNLVGAFSLRLPSFRFLLAGVCIGLAAWIPARALLSVMLLQWEIPSALTQLDDALKTALSGVPAWAVLLALAVIPAVSEEFLFRGMLLGSMMPKAKRGAAIVITAAVFAAFHMMFIRFPITFGLGLLFGYLCWQSRSVWPALIAHALHNGIGSSDLSWPNWQERVFGITQDAGAFPPWWTLALAVAVMALGLLLARRPDAETRRLASGGHAGAPFIQNGSSSEPQS